MAYELSTGMLAKAIEAFEAIITQWGKDCVLEFPRTRTECPNCEINIADGTSAGVYKTGGPSSFPAGSVCPVCTGDGYIETAQTLTIRMRVYDDPKEWFGNPPPGTADGVIQTRCALRHYAAIKTSHRMKIDEEPYRDRYYEPWGDPVDHYGPLKGQWVVLFWKRIR